MNEDMDAAELAQIIADALEQKGIKARLQGHGASAFARMAVKLPSGQVFTIQIEEE